MSYFSNISSAITTLIDGMKVTMGYFVRPREHVTLQYPDEVWPIPERNIGVGQLDDYNTVRSKLAVNFEDCIGCKACERACPVNCINIETFKAGPEEDIGTTSNGTKKKLLVTSFTIDMSECMYCDLCTPPCPEDCIFMTPDYQFISNDNQQLDVTPEQRWRDRGHLIYEFSKVTPEERKRRQDEAEAAAAKKAAAMEAKKAAAAKAAAAKAAAEAVAEAKPKTDPAPAGEPKVEADLSADAETSAQAETSMTADTVAVNVPVETVSVPKPEAEQAPSEAAPSSETEEETKESDNG